jgi:hypothetical protein
VINEGANGKALRKLRCAANVVHMKMSDEDVIDPAKASCFSGRDDTPGVTPREPWPASVDQHGLPRWGHKQRGLTALYINEVDL